MAGSASISLPILELDAGYGPGGIGEAVLPILELSAEALDGPGGTADISLPALELSASFSYTALIVLPAIELSATIVDGPTGAALLTLPALEVSAAAFTDNHAAADVVLPGLHLSAGVLSEGLLEAQIDLPALRLAASGEAGANGTASLELPAIILAAVSGEPIVGTAELSLPAIDMTGNGYNTPADVWRTWVMHLENKAVTEYTNFEFTSYMVFNGNVYASNTTGIFLLDEVGQDASVNIDGSFLTGKYNFDDSHTKRIPRLYAEAKLDGDFQIKTVAEVTGTRTYGLYYDGLAAIRTRRVPIGRGPRSVYWQFGGQNVAGADFEFVRILLHPEVTKRRVF